MEVRVGSYYLDKARDAQQEIHVTLTDTDGELLWPDEWEGWDVNTRFSKLSAMADIQSLQYAITRDYRDTREATEQIRNLIVKYLKK